MALLLAALGWGLSLAWRAWTGWQQGQAQRSSGPGSLSWGLRQPVAAWVGYPIPADALEVRVLSNLIHADPRHLERDYAVEYRLETTLGSVLASGTVHLSATALSGAQRIPTLSNSALSAASTREFVIARTDPRQRRIRLRWSPGRPTDDAAEVFLRVYSRNRLSDRELAQRWRSLTEQERRSLAAHFAEPLEWLSAGERAGMVARAWRPLATTDDIPLELLRLPESDETGAVELEPVPSVPPGDWLDSNHERAYGLRADPVTLTLHSVGHAGATVHVQAFDDSGRNLLDRQVATTTSTKLALPGGPGRVYLRASAPVTLVLPDADRPAMTTATLARYLLVGEGAQFDLAASTVARHLRISGLFPGPASRILLQGLDASGAVRWQRSLGASAAPSAAIQDVRQPDQILRSEPPVYLSMPPHITRLRVTGSAEALVRVASRPANLPLVRRLGPPGPGVPTWFELQPLDSAKLTWRSVEHQRLLPEAAPGARATGAAHPLAALAGGAGGLVLMPIASADDSSCLGRYVPGMMLRTGGRYANDDVRIVYFSPRPVAGFVTTTIGAQRHVWPVSGRSGYWRQSLLDGGVEPLRIMPGPLDGTEVWVGPVARAQCRRRLRETLRVGGSGLEFAVPALRPGQSLRIQVMAPSTQTGSLELAIEGGKMAIASSTYQSRHWQLPLAMADTPVLALGELTRLQMPRTLTLAVANSTPADFRLKVTGRGQGRLAMVRVWVQDVAAIAATGTPAETREADAPELESEP